MKSRKLIIDRLFSKQIFLAILMLAGFLGASEQSWACRAAPCQEERLLPYSSLPRDKLANPAFAIRSGVMGHGGQGFIPALEVGGSHYSLAVKPDFFVNTNDATNAARTAAERHNEKVYARSQITQRKENPGAYAARTTNAGQHVEGVGGGGGQGGQAQVEPVRPGKMGAGPKVNEGGATAERILGGLVKKGKW